MPKKMIGSFNFIFSNYLIMLQHIFYLNLSLNAWNDWNLSETKGSSASPTHHSVSPEYFN